LSKRPASVGSDEQNQQSVGQVGLTEMLKKVPILGERDGVDGARAASGSMKGRAKMVVV
jgi:hypothetical protein